MWSRFQASKSRTTLSHGNIVVSASATMPVSSAISEFAILNVDAGRKPVSARSRSDTTRRLPATSSTAKVPAVSTSANASPKSGCISTRGALRLRDRGREAGDKGGCGSGDGGTSIDGGHLNSSHE